MNITSRSSYGRLFCVIAFCIALPLSFAAAGTVSISVAPSSIDEGDDAVFTFTNSPIDFSRNTKVIYYTFGSASYGNDFTLSGTPGIVIIPAGQASADVVLHARFDGNFDLTEEVSLIVGESKRYGRGTRRATVTIFNVQ